MAKNWYPVINEEVCIECGACTDRCKKGVYAATTMPPQVIQPDSCSFRCECCGDLCPVDAITYYSEPTLFNITKGSCGGH